MNLIDEFHVLSRKKRIELCKSNFRPLKCANCKKVGFRAPNDKFNIWCYESEDCIIITGNKDARDMYIPYDIKAELKKLKNIWR